jgi:Na+/melibiose symporter-like transporter
MLFLLFYYTDALGLPMTTAAAIYTAASIWDGIANFVAGAVTDRRQPKRGYGRVLILGSVPLGLACILTYAPLGTGIGGLALVVIGHLLFRTAYAALNVPYLAMGARISVDSRDRAFVAGRGCCSGRSPGWWWRAGRCRSGYGSAAARWRPRAICGRRCCSRCWARRS